MSSSLDWKRLDAERRYAAKQGEEIASAYEFHAPPVDPLRIVQKERSLIHAVGADFGNKFDGRIKYIGPRFLLCYNTRYNSWQHTGLHHSKILFTIAHELGHFFIESHRRTLVKSGSAHGSQTEFVSKELVEQQADHFATGLLMPTRLLRPRINQSNFPSLTEIKGVRQDFQVALTGLLVRWTQLCDFPCATIATYDGIIQLGWVSEGFQRIGAYRVRRGEPVTGREALEFIRLDPAFRSYRDKAGSGAVKCWLDFDEARIPTAEYYFAIPYSRMVWIVVFADEDDLPDHEFD